MKKVKKGMQELNLELGRYWVFVIDTNDLDIKHYYRCVLGQLFGSYGEGQIQLAINSKEAYKLGFDPGERDVEKLTQNWIKHIDRQREELTV